jgi:hypothetical protein
MVWGNSSLLPPFDADVLAQQLIGVGAGGPVVDLGGGCGAGGTLVTQSPAAVSSTGFGFVLSGASPAASLTLVNMTFGAVVPLPCGPCTFEPAGVLLFRPIVAGQSGLPLSLPCNANLVGASIRAQFATLTPGTTPCALTPEFSFSNRVLVTIGE